MLLHHHEPAVATIPLSLLGTMIAFTKAENGESALRILNTNSPLEPLTVSFEFKLRSTLGDDIIICIGEQELFYDGMVCVFRLLPSTCR